MFVVMDLAPTDDDTSSGRRRVSPDADVDSSMMTSSWQQQSSFLQVAYAKARSITGVSMASTDVSSDSSTSGDPLDSLDASDLGLSKHPQDIEETFYDCRSQAGSHTSLSALNKHITAVSREDESALYVNNMCVYADGSPAFAPPWHCRSKVSEDFLEFHDYDEKKAEQKWKDMLKWREESEVWKIHARPNAHFNVAKQYYPSCYHGVDKEDAVVEFSLPGKMVPEKLFEKGLDPVMEHHCFMQEYMHNCLYTDEESWREIGKEAIRPVPGQWCQGVVLVIDVKGAGINILSGSVFAFMKRMIHNSTSYYPSMAKRVVVINSPFWVSGVFRTLKPLLPDELEVDIVSAKDSLTILREYIDDDQIPVEYGGSCPYRLNQHPFELRVQEKAKEAANYGKATTTCSTEGKSSCPDTILVTAASLDDTVDTSSVESNNSSTSTLGDAPTFSESTSRCNRLPFNNSLTRTREPTFVMDSTNSGELLTLSPNPPTFDFFSATRNIWGSLTNGFDGCGGCKSGR